jgi:Tol biopolymer transport system component
MSPRGTTLLIFADTGGAPRRLALDSKDVVVADWTREGRIRVTAMRHGEKPRAFVIDANGANRREVPVDSIVSANPDSSLRLFEADRGGFSTVFVLDTRKGTSRALTSGVWAEQPSFSHDGRQVVFERRRDPNRMDQSELVLIEPNGANERVIALGTDPSWSRGDSLILFKAMDAAGELFVSVVSPTTRKVTRLARGVHPQWSPGGGRIVYMVDRPDHSSDIYTVRLSDRAIRCISCTR